MGPLNRPKALREVETTNELRFQTGLSELDRVLGGGAVQGSLVLVGGAPGIGKSTLMLQICESLCQSSKVLYVSGEESERQIKLRADRLGVQSEELYLLAETDLEEILESVAELRPDVLIVDSIQTMYHGENASAPGSVAQVKECTMALMQLAKGQGITVFVIGHVNKEGSIAGPKVLEHMVDCVLYFEGEPHMSYRILRAAKNRFGATNEIGVFEMADSGLTQVPNPSETLLAGRPLDTPGTCVTCVMEGDVLRAQQHRISAIEGKDGIQPQRHLQVDVALHRPCGGHRSPVLPAVSGIDDNRHPTELERTGQDGDGLLPAPPVQRGRGGDQHRGGHGKGVSSLPKPDVACFHTHTPLPAVYADGRAGMFRRAGPQRLSACPGSV